MAVAYDFRRCKACGGAHGVPTYHLRTAGTVYVCAECGFHYLDYLDDLESLPDTWGNRTPTEADLAYIEKALHYNEERFRAQVDAVASLMPLRGARCMDIGAGGGYFLHLLAGRGAEVHGIEPVAVRRHYARERFGLELQAEPFDQDDSRAAEHGTFDLVTLWDVIEHVNFPFRLMDDAVALLRPGGLLAIDTPARDAFYYRAGEWSYRLSGGRRATFLDVLYANTPFGHKQILSSADLDAYARRRGHEVRINRKFHELSRPYAHYLRRVVRSERAARGLAPVVGLAIRTLRLANKVLFVMQKAPETPATAAEGR